MPVNSPFRPIIITDLNTVWHECLNLGTPAYFPSGTVFSDTGASVATPDQGMYFIKEGRVRLSSREEGGGETVMLYFGENVFFNEVPMLQPGFGHIYACMGDVQAVFFPKRLVTAKIFKERPALKRNLLESMARKSNYYLARLKAEAGCGALGNISRALYSMHIYNRGEAGIVPLLTQRELAEYLGLNRRTLQRSLLRLRDDGLTGQYSHKHLAVHDEEKLLQLARGEKPRDTGRQ